MRNRNISLIIAFAVLFGLAEVCFAAKDSNIGLEGNGNTITNGDSSPSLTDHTDFDTVDLGNTFDRTFTITNASSADLTLSGNPRVAISGSSDFTVTVQPPATVARNGSETFTVRFAPTAASLRSATISIENDTPGATPYTFDIQGTGN